MSQTEARQRREVADRLHSVAIHLLRHARQQDTLSQQAPARLAALSVLVFGGPMTLGQLANAEQVKAPTMSRIVAGLTRSGLARIEGDAKDARRIVIRVSAKGKRVLQTARQRRIRAVAEILEGLEEKDLATLHAAAALIEQALHR